MYRIFISYSHQDHDLVSSIAQILENNGLQPMWDKNFAFGHGFHEQIKSYIAHAHVFLPVITPTSDERKWVHQEIGYAMALNIPVLPIAAGKLPGEMIQQIHAVHLGDDLGELKEHLSEEAISNLVQRYSDTRFAFYQCAQYAEDRAEMMTRCCKEVLELKEHGLVRQKGALSSFHIPSETIYHRYWKERYGGIDRGLAHCQKQREERLALEAHARVAGCRLIINPYIQYEKYGAAARIVRLKCLLQFLESMTDDKCQVAINPEMEHEQSQTILGDWFVAESVSAQIGQGYRQTIFSRHAPSMLNSIEAFDQEFNERLDAAGWAAVKSRGKVIETLRGILAKEEVPAVS